MVRVNFLGAFKFINSCTLSYLCLLNDQPHDADRVTNTSLIVNGTLIQYVEFVDLVHASSRVKSAWGSRRGTGLK